MTCLKEYNLNAAKRLASLFPLPPLLKEIFILCKQRPESTFMSSVAGPKHM